MTHRTWRALIGLQPRTACWLASWFLHCLYWAGVEDVSGVRRGINSDAASLQFILSTSLALLAMHAQTAVQHSTSKAKKVVQPRRDWVRLRCRYEIVAVLEIDWFIHSICKSSFVLMARFKFFFPFSSGIWGSAFLFELSNGSIPPKLRLIIFLYSTLHLMFSASTTAIVWPVNLLLIYSTMDLFLEPVIFACTPIRCLSTSRMTLRCGK